jgi:hypothetical protein
MPRHWVVFVSTSKHVNMMHVGFTQPSGDQRWARGLAACALLAELCTPPVKTTGPMQSSRRDHPLNPIIEDVEADGRCACLALRDPAATAQTATVNARRLGLVVSLPLQEPHETVGLRLSGCVKSEVELEH